MATLIVKKFPTDVPTNSTKKNSTLQGMFYKPVVTLYRLFAILALYVVLFGVLAYAFMMGFYAVNTSWAAPVILSASDEKSLAFTEKMVTSKQSLENLVVDKNRLTSSISEMTGHRTSLLALAPELQAAIAREKQHNRTAGPQLVQLNQQKQADNAKTQAVMVQVKDVEATIDKDLAAGLITKGDAATQRAALNQAQSSYTDSRISEVMLTDNILEKTTTTKSLDVLDKQAELRSEIAQLDIAISVAEKQIREESQQIDRLKKAIATAKQTPYYLSVSGGGSKVNFAFVPYDNQSSVAVGAPVYDCYLNMVACRQVGTVKQVFSGEEHAIHPIFRTDIRGFMVQLQLDRPESARSKTVFLNRKPLFF